MTNLRYALRSLRNAPGFTLAAVLTLALGIGVNTTAFSVVSALVLRPLPVEDPSALVRLQNRVLNPETGQYVEERSWAFPNFLDHQARGEVFAGLAAQEARHFLLRRGGLEKLHGAAVSGTYFQVLGVKAVRGRTLLPSDDAKSSPAAVAVVSESFWRSRLGADPRALGKQLDIDGHPFTLVGVVGSESVFRALGKMDVWIPIHARSAFLESEVNALDARNSSWAQVFGRLREGVSPQRAQAVAELTARRLAAAYPETNAGLTVKVVPAGNVAGLTMDDEERAARTRAALLLMGVVTMVLLVACANVANLLLARAAGRRREIAIRAALGAGRGHIARQLLTESVLLALAGAAAGMLFARGGLALASRIPEVARVSPTLDLRVLGFTLLIAVAAGLAFGMVPLAGGVARDLLAALRDGGAQGGARRVSLPGVLVVAQIAASVVLVVATGLVLRSLANLTRVDPGFRAAGLLTATVNLGAPGAPPFAPPPAARLAEVLDRVRALPGVEEASFGSAPPLSGVSMTSSFEVPGYRVARGGTVEAGIVAADDAYLRTMKIPLLRGRGFERAGEVLVNRSLAARYWPGRDAVGQPVLMGDDTFRVAGVVGDVRALSIAAEAAPTLYFRIPRSTFAFVTLHVRAAGNPESLVLPLQRVLAAATPDQPAPEVTLMSSYVARSLAQPRRIATFFTLFGALALTLAAIGLYGVMSYSVTQRRREMGIRSALGAAPLRILVMVLRQGGALAAAGSLVGIGVAIATTRAIGSVLYGVEPLDAVSFALAVAVLAASALLASWIPARRAVRVDPMAALRGE